MFSHAPEGYVCPFCTIINECRSTGLEESPHAVVYQNDIVTVLVPMHHYAGIKGNVLIVPNHHYENIFDVDYHIGSETLRVVQMLAYAMKTQFKCDGISTRQHNEPAGNQDAWHYHLHVFPRYEEDHLYRGAKARYDQEERLHYAAILRNGMQDD